MSIKVEKISKADFQEEMDKPRATRKGRYVELLAELKKTGQPVRVSGLTRGQVAALARTAKDNGVLFRADYKNGIVHLGKKA